MLGYRKRRHNDHFDHKMYDILLILAFNMNIVYKQ